eukprot:scaffold12.g8021.t1
MAATSITTMAAAARGARLPARARGARRGAPRARAPLEVRAVQEPETRQDVSSALRTLQLMMQKYDFVSAGLGALAVTTFCVARGQDPQTALWITAASTVVALLVNDMFDDQA